MADILIDAQAGYTGTPASGKSGIIIDSTNKRMYNKDDTGRYWGPSNRNWSITNDASAFASDLYLVGSNVLLPSFGIQAGSRYWLRASASKTGAGTATPAYTIRIGTAGAIGDTSRLALTGPAQTAIADIGTLNVLVICRVVSATVGVLQGTAWWDHTGTAASTTVSGTGFANDVTGHVQGTSANFDNSALGGSYIGLSLNGGASAAWTVTIVDAQLDI